MDNSSTGKCTSWIFPAALWTHEWKQWEEMAFSHKLISISSMADVHFTTLPPFKCPNQYTTSGPQMTTFRHNVRKPKQIFVNVMNMLLFKYSKKNVWLRHFNKKGRNWGISGNPHEEQLKLKAANSNWQSESNDLFCCTEKANADIWARRNDPSGTVRCFSAVAVARQQTKGSSLSQSATCGCPPPSRSSFPPC